jgi:predicted TIM-barrel fold metal-dependent hydrolase
VDGLIDTHQHLILRDRLGYGWTSGLPALAGDFTPADYARLTAGRGIAGTIFMETGVDDADWQAEARLVAGLVGQGGMLGQIAGCRPEEDGFDDWLDECAGLHVVGVRRILHEVDEGVSQGARFRANLRRLAARGLPFDLCFHGRQLATLAVDLLRACPDQAFVLDHCGTPDIAGGDFDRWAAGIDAVAAFATLWVKLSGLTAYAPAGSGMPAIRPYVDHVLERFGPGRMLWGSDWPVVDLGAGLPGWIDLTRAILADLSGDERATVTQGNARRVYLRGTG